MIQFGAAGRLPAARCRRAALPAVALVALFACVQTVVGLAAGGGAAVAATHAPGLQAQAQVVRDGNGVPHIYTQNDHDTAYMLGWVHAQDRFFQMDMLRRTFSGTLAELVGQGGLASDVQLRTLGLRRAAEESLPKYPATTVAWLQAYADGVNAYVAANALPPEYGALALSKVSVPAWTTLDCLVVAKGLAFQLSFDLSDIDNTIALGAFEQAAAATGAPAFDPVDLYFDDVYREAPFDPTISIPGWLAAHTQAPPPGLGGAAAAPAPAAAPVIDPAAVALAKRFRAQAQQVPVLKEAFAHSRAFTGSNWWVVGGALSQSGHPLLANDPHLSLSTPPVFYEVHLLAYEGGDGNDINVTGVSFPGTPAVVLGCNLHICWGATTNPMDVTDIYLEQLVVDPSTGAPVATTFDNAPEPLVVIPQVFRFNASTAAHPDTEVAAPIGPAAGGVTLVVPRRNNGPIVSIDTSNPAAVTALSVQYTGWRDTREIDSLLIWQRARNVNDFKRGLEYFHFGSQNWSYADVAGNVAYFTSGAQPLREDLQNLQRPDGSPPIFIRDGTHHYKNEWLPRTTTQPGQQLDYQILPVAEMPQVINPAQGYVLTANNDPIGSTLDNNIFDKLRLGGGIYYFGLGYSSLRSGQISKQLQAGFTTKGKLGAADLMTIQHNNQLLDAEFFVPYIQTALTNASRPGAPAALATLAADPQVLEAVQTYLAPWDFSTPTGILGGYDPGDNPADLPFPTRAQVNHSVATTLYTLWRSQFVQVVIDSTLNGIGLAAYVPDDDHALRALKQLLVNYPSAHGSGASGLYFFGAAGSAASTPEDARDLLLLQSVRAAIDQLASSTFAAAFPDPTHLSTLRWGKLHRIVFSSLLGGPFDIPGSGDFSDLAPDLPGISRPGGYETIDAASFGVRITGLNDAMFGSGPARRFVGEMIPNAIAAYEIVPGGESGVVGSPDRANQLGRWLTDAYHPLLITPQQVHDNAVTTTTYLPAP